MDRPRPELRIAWDCQGLPSTGTVLRHFIGLHSQPGEERIEGALVRVFGRGLSAAADVVATASSGESPVDGAGADGVRCSPRGGTPAEVAEAAATVASSLASRLLTDQGTALAIGLQGFGTWQEDRLHGRCFLPHCDTARLSQLSGLTVVDDFPGRDLADQGRGGPCEAAGAWLLLADRGTIPGRRIRALLDLGDTVRLTLLPPRQSGQLPPHLLAFDVSPGNDLLTEIARQLVDGQPSADLRGSLAVQGRQMGPLLEGWLDTLDAPPVHWHPMGYPLTPLLQILQEQLGCQQASLHDVLCTAVHLIARRIVQLVKQQLPRSQPVGQLILTGSGRRNGFLVCEIQRQLPEIEVSSLDAWSIPSSALPAAATALLAQLHIDQVPANSPGLTGAESPRILGRLSPGRPANWHQVLADMAVTLPEKLPLRSAV